MRIALQHDALIPPVKYGGTERIVYWLGKALLRLGHEVTLVAKPGSRLEGAKIVQRLEQAEFDLVHLWSTPQERPKVPYLITIEGNGQPGERFLPNTVFISRKHALNHGSELFVYNGIDPDDYPCDPQREDRLVFLAKASWKVKNLAGAIELARAAALPLDVMGSRSLPFEAQRWSPPVGGVRYWGMADDVLKRKLLRTARALLFPVRWHEPFGIAITEALASGCAVFGTPYGSLPEIVSKNVGFLSDDASKILSALRSSRFDPGECRARVSQGFSHLDMARSYLPLYEKILGGALLVPESDAPRAQFKEPADTLLPYRFLAPSDI